MSSPAHAPVRLVLSPRGLLGVGLAGLVVCTLTLVQTTRPELTIAPLAIDIDERDSPELAERAVCDEAARERGSRLLAQGSPYQLEAGALHCIARTLELATDEVLLGAGGELRLEADDAPVVRIQGASGVIAGSVRLTLASTTGNGRIGVLVEDSTNVVLRSIEVVPVGKTDSRAHRGVVVRGRSSGVVLDKVTVRRATQYGISLEEGEDLELVNITATGCGDGIKLGPGDLRDVRIRGALLEGNLRDGFDYAQARGQCADLTGLVIEGMVSIHNGYHGIAIKTTGPCRQAGATVGDVTIRDVLTAHNGHLDPVRSAGIELKETRTSSQPETLLEGVGACGQKIGVYLGAAQKVRLTGVSLEGGAEGPQIACAHTAATQGATGAVVLGTSSRQVHVSGAVEGLGVASASECPASWSVQPTPKAEIVARIVQSHPWLKEGLERAVCAQEE